MNPEAVEWLESLDEEQRLDLFKPAVGAIGLIASLKLAHESSRLCLSAGCYRPGELVTFQ